MERVEDLVREAEALDEAVRLNQAMHAPDRLTIRERDLMAKLQQGPHDRLPEGREAVLEERRAFHDAAMDLFASFRPTPAPEA